MGSRSILEGALEIVVANAQPIKKAPGRKTEVKDAEWIVDPALPWATAFQFRSAYADPRTPQLGDWVRAGFGLRYRHQHQLILKWFGEIVFGLSANLPYKIERSYPSTVQNWTLPPRSTALVLCF
jgi:hypothetical protein